MTDRQTYTASLPNGTTVPIISGSVTIDETWSPYIQGTITVPKPSSLTAFDPRNVMNPLVTINMLQEYNESDPVAVLTTLHSADTVADLTAAYGSGTVADLTVAHTRLWNAGDYREPVSRSITLYIRARNITANDELELELSSAEVFLQESTGVFALRPTSLIALVNAALAEASFPALTSSTTDLGFSYLADPTYWPSIYLVRQTGQSEWDFVSTYLELANARLICDEANKWRIIPPIQNTSRSHTLSALTDLTGFADEVNRDGEWFNYVVIKYTYNRVDPDGTDYGPGIPLFDTSYYASSGRTKALVLERDLGNLEDVPDIPDGTADTIVARVSRFGRAIPVTAVTDITTRPGDALTVITPAGSTVTGRATSVTFDFNSAEMNLSARDIT